MQFLLYLVSLFTFFSHQQVGTPSSGKVTPTQRTAAGANSWRYEQTTDKGATVYKASIISPNILEFGFPYTGGSTLTLTIRKRDSSTNVYLQVANGQFNRSFQGGNVRIRFNNKPASTYAYSAATNGSASIIFLDAEQALIDQIKASQTMLIDIEFFAQGKRQVAFKTANLTWNH